MKICTEKNCETQSYCKGYCRKHYQRLKRHGDVSIVNSMNGMGKHSDPLYKMYIAILGRCFSVTNKAYNSYGGRGITICESWLGVNGFYTFKKDVGNKPTPKHSLDRIDNNGNYEPSNCRWATRHQQQANRRNNNQNVGVSFSKTKWVARLRLNKKQINLGTYLTKEEAIKARKEAEIKYNIYN